MLTVFEAGSVSWTVILYDPLTVKVWPIGTAGICIDAEPLLAEVPRVTSEPAPSVKMNVSIFEAGIAEPDVQVIVFVPRAKVAGPVMTIAGVTTMVFADSNFS